jgi:hypothetical protein
MKWLGSYSRQARGWLFDALEEHLVAHAVVQVFARVDFVAHVHACRVEGIEDRAPAAREFVEGFLDESRRARRPRVEVRPGQRTREGGVRREPRLAEALAAKCSCCTAHCWRRTGSPRTSGAAKPSKPAS